MHLSVVLTNYNDAADLPGAVKAICSQSLRPYEVVVVDDGSTDNSVEIIEKLSRQYDCLRLVKNEKNQGIQYSVRRGISEATGDIIYAASCNDKLFPGLFETGVGLLAQYPEAGVFFADSILEDHVSGERCEKRLGLLDRPGYLSPELLSTRLRGGIIQPNTVLAYRDKLRTVDIYPEALRWHCDWWTFSLLAFKYGACYAPEILGLSVIDANGYSSGAYVRRQRRQVFREVLRRGVREKAVLPLMKESGLFHYFLYFNDVVEVPLLTGFALEHFLRPCAIALVYSLIAEKCKFIYNRNKHRIDPLRHLIYCAYFHSFHWYLRKKLALKSKFKLELKQDEL